MVICMGILKDELFMLAKRNKQIRVELQNLHPHDNEQSHELKKEYGYNIKCIDSIKEIVGPIILDDWRKEWFLKR